MTRHAHLSFFSPLLRQLAATGFCLLAAACGEDDPTTLTGGVMGGNAGTSGSGGSGGGSMACPDHPNVTEASGRCEISSSLAAPITTDLTLDGGRVWLMTGPVVIGDDTAETVLTIEAGTTVFGNDQSFILIQRSSRIVAEGTAAEPIVLTSSAAAGSRAPQDWGGLVINGRAPINSSDNTAGDPGSAPGEADTGRFGGDNAADDSGVLRYVRVEFAGKDVDPENELNGIAFQGVGSGTEVEYVQVHMTQDDGIEFFGGTVNVKHVVITGANDDNIDWTDGWAGKAQFIVAQQLPESGNLSSDPRGIEADNEEGNNSAQPYSSPMLSNITLIGRSGNAFEGMRLRRGTKGQIWNSVLSGWGPCVQVTEAQTIANVADDSLTVRNLVFSCTSAVGGEADVLQAGQDLTAAPANVVAGDPLLSGWQPGAGSPARGIGAGPSDAFFDTVDYAGAFDGTTDWSAGWIESANN
jgi:trimeric autotransporter adhesin